MTTRFDPSHEPLTRPVDATPSGGRAPPAAARRRLLLAAIAERGFVSVADIAREIGMSEMTVRRDLDALQRGGAVERSHGGAVAARPAGAAREPSFDARAQLHASAKRAIARAAAGLIGEREVIGLDVGSTVACLAGLLGNRPGLGVVTNSLRALAALSAAPGTMPDVYMLGGQLRPAEGSLCGAIAQRQLADHWLHKAFIGAAGLSEDGLFDYSVEETQITLGYVRAAAEVIVLCDSSKFGLRGFARVCGLDVVTRLITDAEPPPPLRAALDRNRIQVTVATTLMHQAA
jgi:DeoR family glycerol-3-phosphate regulon repressor